jgi:hypothetical protein
VVLYVRSVPGLCKKDKLPTILRRQLEEYEVGVRWPPACEDVSPGAKERPLLQGVTNRRSEDRDWEL